MNDIPQLPSYMFEATLPGLLSFLAVWVLPLLAGLLSRQSWRASVKGMVLLALSAVKTIVEAFVAGHGDPSFSAGEAFYSTMLNFFVAVALYWGLVRQSRAQEVASNSGIVDPGTN